MGLIASKSHIEELTLKLIDIYTFYTNANSLDEFIELNHYSNLQFLWAVDNMKKGNKYEEE